MPAGRQAAWLAGRFEVDFLRAGAREVNPQVSRSRLYATGRARTPLVGEVTFDMYFYSRICTVVFICILPIGLHFQAARSVSQVHFDTYFHEEIARSSSICKLQIGSHFRAPKRSLMRQRGGLRYVNSRSNCTRPFRTEKHIQKRTFRFER